MSKGLSNTWKNFYSSSIRMTVPANMSFASHGRYQRTSNADDVYSYAARARLPP